MKHFFIVLFFTVWITPKCISQKSLSDYSYVIVSEQFEFQKEKDKYELNSLTKFLFNKYGFHAYFDREVPSNVNRCDGLWVEAEGTPGFIYTKAQLVIRDCNGFEVYRTIFGKSKVKDYKGAYYECVREAFEEIKNLEIQQKEISNSENVLASKTNETDNVKNTSETKIVSIPIENPNTKLQVTSTENIPANKYTNYSNSGKSYLLRKTSKGFNLYQEVENIDDDLQLVGKLTITPTSINFIDVDNKELLAYFDASKNLIIEDINNNIVYTIEN